KRDFDGREDRDLHDGVARSAAGADGIADNFAGGRGNPGGMERFGGGGGICSFAPRNGKHGAGDFGGGGDRGDDICRFAGGGRDVSLFGDGEPFWVGKRGVGRSAGSFGPDASGKTGEFGGEFGGDRNSRFVGSAGGGRS